MQNRFLLPRSEQRLFIRGNWKARSRRKLFLSLMNKEGLLRKKRKKERLEGDDAMRDVYNNFSTLTFLFEHLFHLRLLGGRAGGRASE